MVLSTAQVWLGKIRDVEINFFVTFSLVSCFVSDIVSDYSVITSECQLIIVL